MKIYPASFTNVFGSSSQRRTVIKNMTKRNPPRWSDFVKLEALLGADWNRWFFKAVDTNVIEAMCEIAQRTTPQPLSYPLSESNLYNAYWWLRADHGHTTASWNPENSETIDLSYEMGLVLSTVETILEKIGDQLPDETRIIESYLSSNYEHSLQCAGARLVLSTSKHRWRNSSKFIDRLIGLMNRKFSDDTYVLSPGLRKDVKRGIVSANPSYLFSKYSDVDEYICYEGKDPVMEKILLGCANEDSPEVRREAFGAIGEYLQRHEIAPPLPDDTLYSLEIKLLNRQKHLIDHSLLDETLVSGVEKGDANALFALYHRLNHGVINNPKLFPLLVRSCDDSVWQNRMFAFTIISILSERENIDSSVLKPLCRRHFNDENEDVRVNALDLFGKILKRESVLEIETADIGSLENIGCCS